MDAHHAAVDRLRQNLRAAGAGCRRDDHGEVAVRRVHASAPIAVALRRRDLGSSVVTSTSSVGWDRRRRCAATCCRVPDSAVATASATSSRDRHRCAAACCRDLSFSVARATGGSDRRRRCAEEQWRLDCETASVAEW
ncbi:MAG: hypothetical protein AAF368_02365 [Planctomycetota bacterium]